jgi:hypothetical protein
MAKSNITTSNNNSKTSKKTTVSKTTVAFVSTSNDNKKAPKGKLTVTPPTKTPVSIDVAPASIEKVSATSTKTKGSGSNQLGKKRGTYTNNIWVLEYKNQNEKTFTPDLFDGIFESRDLGREAVQVARDYARNEKLNETYRLAKYVLASVDHS